MGLIAVVYRAKQNLAFNLEEQKATIDARTGAIYFRDPGKKSDYPREVRQAIRVNLGASNEILEITKELGPVLGAAESVLSERVLYEVSHSGDVIERRELDLLEIELRRAQESLGQRASKRALQFLADMKMLVKTAREQRNPIVFV